MALWCIPWERHLQFLLVSACLVLGHDYENLKMKKWNVFWILVVWLQIYNKGKERAAFCIKYRKWKSPFSKEKQILLCLCVLNIRMQHVVGENQSLRKTKRRNVCSSIRKWTGLLTLCVELSTAFCVIVLLTCWNSSLWEGKEKPFWVLSAVYIPLYTYSFVW